VITYWSTWYLNQYWLPQDMTDINEKLFKGLSIAIKTMKNVKELVEIGLNEVFDRLVLCHY